MSLNNSYSKQTFFDLLKLDSVLEKRKDCNEDLYLKIKNMNLKCVKTKSKNDTIYGMFLPHKDLMYYIPKYQGTIATDTDNIDFKYYFDENDRIVMTEGYKFPFAKKEIIYYIFYFYCGNDIECVFYDLKLQCISSIKIIECEDEKIKQMLDMDVLLLQSPMKIRNYLKINYDYSGDKTTVRVESYMDM